jgi:hypothetical protein
MSPLTVRPHHADQQDEHAQISPDFAFITIVSALLLI